MKTSMKVSFVVALLFVLTGCSNGSNSSGTPSPTPSSTPSASTTPANYVCTSSQLSILLGVEGAAMGSRGVTGMAFKNISATACTLEGYPTAQMIDAPGKTIPTHITHGTEFSSPTAVVKVITLAPGKEAKFDVLYEAQTGYGNAYCPTSSKVKFTPPGSKTPLILTWKIQPYGGTVQNLRCGEIRVSPLYVP